jgi:hypothetical protein
MELPGFTAEASLYTHAGHYSSFPRNGGSSTGVQPAKLPGEEAPGVYGIRCGNCVNNWQWCEKTLDGQSLDLPPFKRQCTPSAGPVNGGGGANPVIGCAIKYGACVLGCQAIPFPGNFACLAACTADRIECNNPF